MTTDSGPAVAADEAAAVDRVLSSTATPGATLTGAERHQVALWSRRAMADASNGCSITASPDGEVTGDGREWLVDRVTTAAATIRPTHIDQLDDAGLDAPTYVEIVGLVARLQAVDTFCFAIGAELPELPAPIDGPPTGIVADNAGLLGGWIPTVGPASPPNALTLLPDEHEAMHDLHGALYLSVEGMADLDADRGLHRTQMEFVAARTSLLNECFF
ncbi:MAG: hypothetical protein OEW83_09655 [Acidimicrobiia bacterium]|nr:hypothetical protein [Acidimicrobiia bacterium]